MKKTLLKVLSVMLSVICLFSCVNVTAFADDEDMTKPEELTATLLSGTKKPTIQLTWKDDEEDWGTNKYYIYRKASSEKKYKLIAKIDRNDDYPNKIPISMQQEYKDSTVKANTIYYYKVKGVYYANKEVFQSSEFSDIVSCSSAVNKPVIKATPTGEKQIKLSWEKVDGASRYYIYYSESKNGTYKCIGYTKKNSYTFKNLRSSTKYYFKVKSAKVSNKKVYKSIYSEIVSTSTLSKDGEFIVEFEKISNKEAGLPTGSAITCLAMVLNHYGADVTAQELYKYFDCSTDFYYNDEGDLYGPHILYNFVGDPTTDKAYGYGTDIGYIGHVRRDYFKKNNITNIETDQINFYNPENVVSKIKEGNIYLVRIRFDREFKVLKWSSRDSLILMCVNEKYVIACGVTEDEYIVYDPATDKFEKYAFEYKGYHPIVAMGSYKNK